jgi:glycosyltransferase involved in cell wall biosynthesis
LSAQGRKIAFVTPWFSGGNGGAEVFCAGLARNLAEFGREVEVLTTCCADAFHDWGENTLPTGTEIRDGYMVRRFPVVQRDGSLYAHYWGLLDMGAALSREQQADMMRQSINSEAMYQFIGENRDKYWFFFLPYLYGTTYQGVRWALRENAFVIPCLHNEPMAYTDVVADTMRRASGSLFLSEPEAELAHALYDLREAKTLLIGGAVSPDIEGHAQRFRAQRGIDRPFLLFVGRKVPGKGADVLLQYFRQYLQITGRNDLSLVLLGSGSLDAHGDAPGQIVSLVPRSHQEVYDAMSACEFLVQPSFFESFSLVMMEAWLCGRAVLVNGRCDVTRHHAVNSNGGLYFTSLGEFCETVDLLLGRPDVRAQLAAAGRRYVLQNFTWTDVVRRFLNFVARIEVEGRIEPPEKVDGQGVAVDNPANSKG